MPTAEQKRFIAKVGGPVFGAGYRVLRALADRRPTIDLSDPQACWMVRKVLAVRLDNIGDLLLSEPALGILRERFPNARIDLVAGAAAIDLLHGNPAVDRIIVYRAPWHEAWRGGSIDWRAEATRFWRTTGELRREEYDAGFELRGDPRDTVFLAAARPRVLAGSDLRGGAEMLDYPIHLDWWSGHQVTNAAAVASAGLAPPTGVRAPKLCVSQDARAKAEAVVTGTTIALHLGAGFPSKQLAPEKFGAVIRALRCREPSRQFVVVGGPGEGPVVEALGETVCDLTGRLTLQETAAVLERCQLFIGNDSGPMHMAAAVGTPVVACFGPSETWRFHPYGVPHRIVEVPLECRPCDYVHCVWPEGQKYQCMVRQDTDAIVAKTEELLGGDAQ